METGMLSVYQQALMEFRPRDYEVFAGLDVDKTKMAVTFVSHERAIKSIQIPHDANNLLGYVQKHFPQQKLAFTYEAGPTGYKLYDSLSRAGYPCLVVAPSMVPTPPGKHVKTNRLDSEKLAESLRGGALQSIRVPSVLYRELRHLVHMRDTSVRQAVAAKQRIKSLLLFESIPFPKPPESSEWSRATLKNLRALEGGPGMRFKLGQLLDQLEFSHRQVITSSREIRSFCSQDEELTRCIGYLRSIPGIGWIVASHLLARIGDWRHLRNVRQLASFLGLTQREHSTGDRVRRGPITGTGDPRLLNKLIQAAWVAIRKDGELREFYRRIHSKHPRPEASGKAIVAVARKMSMRIHSVLYEQRPYSIRQQISSTPLTQEETAPQGMTRIDSEPKRHHEFGFVTEDREPGAIQEIAPAEQGGVSKNSVVRSDGRHG